LIAAVADQSSIRWDNGRSETTGATGTAIGTGSANTDAIINKQGQTETSYAAGLARAYTGGGYNDWFLPSKDELNKMYLNRATINTTAASNSGSDFGSSYYWSSTENDNDNAWMQRFIDGFQTNFSKSATRDVRAVRAF
jgi:phage FluMu gp28-like protein